MPAHRLTALLLAGAMAACAPTVQDSGPLAGAVPAIGEGNEPAKAEEGAPARILFTTRDGLELPGRAWRAEEPWALLVGLHGMNDYSNAFDGVARYLAAHGISVYAYDQRGFGEAPQRGIWPGTQALAADAADFLAAVRREAPGRPLYLMGLSMGAAVALLAAAREDTPIEGLVLAAPAVWGWSSLPLGYRAALWLGAHTFPWKSFTGADLDIWPSDNIEMLRAYAADPLVLKATRMDAIYGLVDLMEAGARIESAVTAPTLILYGKKDQIIPADPVSRLAGRLGGPVRWALYPDGYHMILRDLQREVVWADLAAWLADRSAALPSGHERPAPGAEGENLAEIPAPALAGP